VVSSAKVEWPSREDCSVAGSTKDSVAEGDAMPTHVKT
jgi:hypothetical protein